MFGMAAFAFEGAGVVIPTECSMKRPEKFNQVRYHSNRVSNRSKQKGVLWHAWIDILLAYLGIFRFK